MSLINVNGQVDQNSAAQLATQLAQIIQSAPNTPEKINFIRDLAAQLGVSTPEQSEDNDDDTDENRVDFEDVACGCTSLSIDTALANVDEAIEKLEAVKRTLEKCKDDDGRYVIWNNDSDFDYETGDPENI